MSRRKELTAEPSVRVEDIMAARDGKNFKVNFSYKNLFYFYLRFMSYGKNMWYKRNCNNSIKTS